MVKLLLALVPLALAGPGASDGGVAVFDGAHPLAPGDAIWLEHGGLVWTLALREADDGWVLALGDHPHRMEPIATWTDRPADPVLRWAGDRDGDDLLDVVVDLPDRRLEFVTSRHTFAPRD